MRFKLVGNKADTGAIVIRNVSTAVTIKAGTPVYLNLASTGDDAGRGVVASESGTAAGVRMGMAMSDLPPGRIGEAMVYGFSSQAVVVANTRAASTDTWASVASVAAGAILLPRAGVSGVQGWATTSGLPTTAVGVYGVLMDSMASRATQASSVASGQLGDTVGSVRVFLRSL